MKQAKRNSFLGKSLTTIDMQATLIGIMFVLFGILGLVNISVISGFINYTFTVFLGNYNYIGFFIIIFSGFVHIFQKKGLKLNNLTSLGIMVIIIAILTLNTREAFMNSELEFELELTNFYDAFRLFMPLLSELPIIDGYPDIVSGGIIGYFVYALANSLVSETGTLIIIIILFVIGSLLSLEIIWKQVFKIVKKHKKNKLQQEEVYEKVSQPSQEQQDMSFYQPTPKPTISYVAEDKQPSQSQLKAPRFSGSYTKTLTGVDRDSSLKKASYRRRVKNSIVDEEQPQTVYSDNQKPETRIDTLSKPSFSSNKMTETIQEKVTINEEKPIVSSTHQLPSIDLLADVVEIDSVEHNKTIAEQRMKIINQVFADLNVKAQAVDYQIGPSVTAFAVELDPSTLINSLRNVIDNLAIRLRGLPINFVELVPGKTTSEIQVPNDKISTVHFKEVLVAMNNEPDFDDQIVIPFGHDIAGQLKALPLDDIVHMLIAGSTGSGKSVFMHGLIMSILMRNSPEQVRLLIIDMKIMELIKYQDTPHLLAPIISDKKEAKVALKRLLELMKERYQMFKDAQVNNLKSYNRYAKEHGLMTLPTIITIIDEYNGLVESAPEISDLVEQLAALSRAAGIHLVIATQRPTTKVVTGNIKNNIITKVALMMSLPVDSITVLGHGGADKLLGNGDMLAINPRLSRFGEMRLQGPFVKEDDIHRIVNHHRQFNPGQHDSRFIDLIDRSEYQENGYNIASEEENGDESMYEEIKAKTMTLEYISTSYIQRTYNMGFTRASRMLSRLQEEGIVAEKPDSPQSNKGCRVLINQS
jgi:DNA segregation ATPase FtsK/SpoIIIE, S-DNA-T family